MGTCLVLFSALFLGTECPADDNSHYDIPSPQRFEGTYHVRLDGQDYYMDVTQDLGCFHVKWNGKPLKLKGSTIPDFTHSSSYNERKDSIRTLHSRRYSYGWKAKILVGPHKGKYTHATSVGRHYIDIRLASEKGYGVVEVEIGLVDRAYSQAGYYGLNAWYTYKTKTLWMKKQ